MKSASSLGASIPEMTSVWKMRSHSNASPNTCTGDTLVLGAHRLIVGDMFELTTPSRARVSLPRL
jgi:hypothetical protein